MKGLPTAESVKKQYDTAIAALEIFSKKIKRFSPTAKPFARRAVADAKKNCNLFLSMAQEPADTDRAIKRLKHGQTEAALVSINNTAVLISTLRESDAKSKIQSRFGAAHLLLLKKIEEIKNFDKKFGI